jgi:hypothetical protein
VTLGIGFMTAMLGGCCGTQALVPVPQPITRDCPVANALFRGTLETNDGDGAAQQVPSEVVVESCSLADRSVAFFDQRDAMTLCQLRTNPDGTIIPRQRCTNPGDRTWATTILVKRGLVKYRPHAPLEVEYDATVLSATGKSTDIHGQFKGAP